MIFGLKQSIAVMVLFVLAWSCFGLSFGMIGHGLMQMEGMGSEDMAAMHECCGMSSEDLGATAGMSMDHHSATIATLLSFDLLSFITVLPFIFAFAIVVVHIYLQVRLYARQWLERWSFFSLYINRLFSQGILHTQVW